MKRELLEVLYPIMTATNGYYLAEWLGLPDWDAVEARFTGLEPEEIDAILQQEFTANTGPYTWNTALNIYYELHPELEIE